MTTTARTCPRCATRLYDESDMYGTYSECIACGFHEDTSRLPTVDDPTDSLPYVGIRVKWDGLVAGFHAVRDRHGRNITKRSVFCPMLYNNNPCRLPMEATGAVMTRKLKKQWGKSMSPLREYRCDRNHYIGVKQDYTGYAI